MKLGLTPDQSTETETLLDTHHHTSRRHYTKEDNQVRISEWVPLEKGKKYYIEADHQEWYGGDHFTLSVEIEQAELNPAHPRNMKEIQYLAFETKDVKEITKVYVKNPDDGEFRIQFMNPKTLKRSVSEPIKADASAGQLKNVIYIYYKEEY